MKGQWYYTGAALSFFTIINWMSLKNDLKCAYSTINNIHFKCLSALKEIDVFQDHCCVLDSIIGWNSTIGIWSRIEGTPNDPNPNKPFAKLEAIPTFSNDGKLNPSITVIGKF